MSAAVLQDMGFPLDHCEEALRRSDGDAELAMEWLLHQQARDQGSGASPRDQVAADRSFVPDTEAMAVLTAMGFHEEAVAQALRATNNDADEACNWLMETADGGDDSSLADDSYSRDAGNWELGADGTNSGIPTGGVAPGMDASTTRTPAPPFGADHTLHTVSTDDTANRAGATVASARQPQMPRAPRQGFTVPGTAGSASSNGADILPRRHVRLGSAERVPSSHKRNAHSEVGVTPNNLFNTSAISTVPVSTVRRMPSMGDSSFRSVPPIITSPKVRFASMGTGSSEGGEALRRQMEAAVMQCELLNHQLDQERALSAAFRQQLQQQEATGMAKPRASMALPPTGCTVVAGREMQRAQLAAYLSRRLKL
jgi:hypothetical protein